MITTTLRNALLGGLAMGLCSSVFAMPDFSLIDVCDVTLGSACADAVGSATGNDSNSAVNTVFPDGDDWVQLLKTDSGSAGSYMGIDFTMTGGAPGAATSGDFTLNWSADPASLLPKAVDLIFVLKASPGWAGYLFDDEVLTDQGGGAGSSDGTWEITFTNPGGQIPGISHLAVYIRDGVCDPGNPICDPGGPGNLPAPGTLLLLGLGLLGFRVSRSAKA